MPYRTAKQSTIRALQTFSPPLLPIKNGPPNSLEFLFGRRRRRLRGGAGGDRGVEGGGGFRGEELEPVLEISIVMIGGGIGIENLGIGGTNGWTKGWMGVRMRVRMGTRM